MTIPIVFYTRRDCPLCEAAAAALEAFAARFPICVDYRDVDASPDWRADFGLAVPVAFVGGRKLFQYRVDEAALEAALLDYGPAASDDGT